MRERTKRAFRESLNIGAVTKAQSPALRPPMAIEQTTLSLLLIPCSSRPPLLPTSLLQSPLILPPKQSPSRQIVVPNQFPFDLYLKSPSRFIPNPFSKP